MMIIFSFLFLCTITHAEANFEAIYGVDDRVDTIFSKTPMYQVLAQSTAAMIHKKYIVPFEGKVVLRGPSLLSTFNLCSNQRFSNQPSLANCTGVLVASDIIATAGHCFKEREKCEDYNWVFNYKIESPSQTQILVNSDEVYKCTEIIEAVHTNEKDFALVRLDRPVIGIVPVKISNQPVIEGMPLVMIGHPSGLPQKIADNAKVLKVREYGFMSNLDAFQINSGSAVFHAHSGELVGVLSGGKQDYSYNSNAECWEVTVFNEEDGGEEVSLYKQFLKD